jgi:hypothetical protein
VRLIASRKWISRRGPKSHLRVTFVLRLRRGAVVEFTVFRIAPDCRLAGTFRVKAHAGVNRVGFRGRIGRRELRPGTYLIRARTVPANPADTVLETKLVIFRSGKPSRRQVRAAQAADVCPRPTFERIGLGFGVYLAANGPAGPGPGAAAQAPGARTESAGRDDRASSVLGARFDRAEDAVKAIHPLIWLGLGIALALLALAAVPVEAVRGARVAAVLAYRRAAVAVAGAATLILVTVAYMLS